MFPCPRCGPLQAGSGVPACKVTLRNPCRADSGLQRAPTPLPTGVTPTLGVPLGPQHPHHLPSHSQHIAGPHEKTGSPTRRHAPQRNTIGLADAPSPGRGPNNAPHTLLHKVLFPVGRALGHSLPLLPSTPSERKTWPVSPSRLAPSPFSPLEPWSPPQNHQLLLARALGLAGLSITFCFLPFTTRLPHQRLKPRFYQGK